LKLNIYLEGEILKISAFKKEQLGEILVKE
jgi:hypothetical protein